MDRLKCLQVFLEVARSGSFVRAAAKLSLSKATVTKSVAWLESGVGAQLLSRSSRQVVLTESGQRMTAHAIDLLERYDSMESEVRGAMGSPRGTVRIGAPAAFASRPLSGALACFSRRYPDIEVVVVHDDGRMDLVADMLDLSIRISPPLRDAGYIAAALTSAPQALVASPAYLRRYRRPAALDDLVRHNCLVNTVKSPSGVWRFAGEPGREIRVQGSLRSNLGEVLKMAAIEGAGIAMHPLYMVSRELEEGLLERVLASHPPEELQINLIYSTRRHMPARVKCLLDFLKSWAARPAGGIAARQAREESAAPPVAAGRARQGVASEDRASA